MGSLHLPSQQLSFPPVLCSRWGHSPGQPSCLLSLLPPVTEEPPWGPCHFALRPAPVGYRVSVEVSLPWPEPRPHPTPVPWSVVTHSSLWAGPDLPLSDLGCPQGQAHGSPLLSLPRAEGQEVQMRPASAVSRGAPGLPRGQRGCQRHWTQDLPGGQDVSPSGGWGRGGELGLRGPGPSRVDVPLEGSVPLLGS